MRQSLQKYPQVHFVLAKYSRAWGLHYVWLICPMRLHRRKLNFPLSADANGRQLIGGGSLCSLPPPVLGLLLA